MLLAKNAKFKDWQPWLFVTAGIVLIIRFSWVWESICKQAPSPPRFFSPVCRGLGDRASWSWRLQTTVQTAVPTPRHTATQPHAMQPRPRRTQTRYLSIRPWLGSAPLGFPPLCVGEKGWRRKSRAVIGCRASPPYPPCPPCPRRTPKVICQSLEAEAQAKGEGGGT